MLPAPPIVYTDAQGALTGTLQDASQGLTKMVDSQGNVWAWNDGVPVSQWMLVWELKAGETIWNLLPDWYGAQTLDLVHLVRDVPQNTPILGSDAAQAYPGDLILVPNLSDPFGGAPPAAVEPSDGGLELPPPGVLPGLIEPTDGGTAPAPTNGGTAPAPTNGGTGPAPTPASTNGEVIVPTNGATNGQAAPSWWTPGKIAAVSVGGLAAVGLGAYLIWGRK